MNNILNNIITLLIIPILPVLAAFAVALIKKKTLQIEQSIKNTSVNTYINIAEDAVCTAVTEVTQTFVDILKKTGKFERKDQEEAFKMAREKALAIMGSKGQQALKELYDDVDAWLNSKIEYYVKASKR